MSLPVEPLIGSIAAHKRPSNHSVSFLHIRFCTVWTNVLICDCLKVLVAGFFFNSCQWVNSQTAPQHEWKPLSVFPKTSRTPPSEEKAHQLPPVVFIGNFFMLNLFFIFFYFYYYSGNGCFSKQWEGKQTKLIYSVPKTAASTWTSQHVKLWGRSRAALNF